MASNTTPSTPSSATTEVMTGDMQMIAIGVSSCLLGHQVRYDGAHKRHPVIESQLCTQFRCLALCPEYAIGMGVPRQPIKLVQFEDTIHALGVYDNTLDVTGQLRAYGEFVVQQYPALCGYVFKARSPSCAIGSAALFNINENPLGVTSGVYAQQVLQSIPGLPVIEESELTDKDNVNRFIKRVIDYAASLAAPFSI